MGIFRGTSKWIGVLLAALASPSHAQQPFYTDDTEVTDKGAWHLEAFNEIDGLQRPQFPNLRQNTNNYKLNYGLPYHLEIDVDTPYLAIFRALGDLPRISSGIGDFDTGIKWKFHQEAPASRLPAMAATLYVEFPTGDTSQELSSGVRDYVLNVIAQKHLTEKIRVTGNAGMVFAGNTSTGVLGIETTHGRVYTGGISVLREFNSKWTLGAEVYGGFSRNEDLGRSQFQVLVGADYEIRNGLTFAFGVLAGKYTASPRIGAQMGLSFDFPALWEKPKP